MEGKPHGCKYELLPSPGQGGCVEVLEVVCWRLVPVWSCWRRDPLVLQHEGSVLCDGPAPCSVSMTASCLPTDSFVVCEVGQQHYLDKRERFRAL